MQAHVDLHAPRRGKALHAELALKSFNASVCLHVSCEGALDCEGTEALLALEWLLMCVDADVTHQVTGLLKFFGTVRTHVPPDAVFLSDRTWHLHGLFINPFPLFPSEFLCADFFVWVQLVMWYWAGRNILGLALGPQSPCPTAVLGMGLNWYSTQTTVLQSLL